MQPAEIIKEFDAIDALIAEAQQRTSRLKQKLVPVQGRASRKGLSAADHAILKRNQRIGK